MAPKVAPKRRVRVRKDKHRKGLGEEIEAPENNGVRVWPRGGPDKKRKRNGEEEPDEALTAKITGRILKAAREQQEEIEAEDKETALHNRLGAGAAARLRAGALTASLKRVHGSDDDSDSDDDLADALPGLDGDQQDDEVDAELRGRENDFIAAEDEEVSPEDERVLAAFMAPAASGFKQLNLGDLVVAKLREKQQEQGIDMLPEEGEEPPPPDLDEKVVQVYKGVGKLLSRFTVGKVPKAFKIIPNLKNWEEVLWLTDPDSWSPHAMFEATKMFVSNLNARLAQRFLALVLLPRIRRDIADHHKLHFALFMALKKATYKPGAFFKGILLPLCSSRTCTLREAVIMSSCLKRTTIPVLHSAAALLRMADMEYCGTTSFFIRVLLDKKYALPYKVIDGLVEHFLRFADDERQMPVVWHQALLCFVQRYKDEIRSEDKTSLRKLCNIQAHHLVTPEVIRELDHSRNRGSGASAGASTFGAGATFNVGSGLLGSKPAFGGGRVSGAALFAPQSHVAVIGKNVSENVRSMPPVMMMEDE